MQHPTDQPPGKSNPFAAMLAAVNAASGTLPTDPYSRVLAEFLLVARPLTPTWWVPAVNAEPGPEVTRIFDGKLHYERIDEHTWREEKPANEDDPVHIRMFLTWKYFANGIVVDATPAPQVGAYRTNVPPGATIANWQATTTDDAWRMLEQALVTLTERGQAGIPTKVTATRWTPAEGGTIILFHLAGDDEELRKVSPPQAEGRRAAARLLREIMDAEGVDEREAAHRLLEQCGITRPAETTDQQPTQTVTSDDQQ